MADISAKKYFTLIPDVTAPPSFPPSFEDPQDPVNPPGVGGISLYKQLGDVSDSDFIGKNGFVPVVTGENLLTLQPLPNFNIDGLISGGVVQWTGIGYIFNVSSAVARFQGQIINSSPDLLTLTTADGTNPRIDLFILEVLFDGNGVPIGMEADFITGTPASTPVKPQIDPANQIELTQILVPAMSTVPTLTEELIYAENVEWTGSSSGSGTVDFASTNAPFSGSVSIEASNVQNNSKTILTRSANFDLATVQTLGFQIRLKATLGGSQNIGVSFLNSSGNQITNEINIPVDKGLTGIYQFIGIDLNQFAFSTANKEVRAIQFRFQRATGTVTYSGYFLDVIRFEGGINTPIQFGSFVSLTDTPSSYAGQGGRVVAVKSDESGLEFITGGGGGITGSGTANELAYFTGATAIASLPVATYPNLTELSYVKGVTSAIQTQINDKLSDAPSDGSHYARKDGAWVAFTPGIQHAASDGNYYASRNGAWTAFTPFTVAGTPTDGHVVTLVSGVPTWQAPSLPTTGIYQGTNNLTERLIFRGHLAWPLGGALVQNDSFYTITDNTGKIVFDVNPRNGNSYANNGRVTINGAHVLIDHPSNHWGVPVFTIRTGGVSRFAINADGTISLAALNVTAFTTTSSARMTVNFQSWGAREFGVLYNNTNGYNYGGRWMMESINGALIIRAVNLRAINDTTAHSVRVANDSNVETLRILGNHSIILSNYPTTNPLTAGRIWCDPADGFTLKVSQG